MKFTNLHLHPLEIWFDKNELNIYNTKSILNNLHQIFPTLYSLDFLLKEEETRNLQGRLVSFLNEILLHYIDFKYHFISTESDEMQKEITSIISIYKIILEHDNKKQTVVWQPFTLSLIDHFSTGQVLLDNLCPNLFKKTIYKELAITKLTEQLIKLENSFLNHDMFSENIKKLLDNIERYGKKIEWHNVLEKNSSLPLAIIARECRHDFKSQQLFELFHHFSSSASSSFLDDNMVEEVANIYNDILISSTFFRNSLAPTKNIQQSIKKFLNINNSTYSSYYSLKFIDNVIHFKGFNVVNYEHKLHKNKCFKIMGKYFLNEEDRIIFDNEIKKKEQTISKKIKI